MSDTPKILGEDGKPAAAPEPEQMSEEQVQQMNLKRLAAINEAIHNLHQVMGENVPPCRSRSIAITKLEECGMWLLKAVTHMEGM